MKLPDIEFHGCLALLTSNTQPSLLLFETNFFSRSGHNVLIGEFRLFQDRLQEKGKGSAIQKCVRGSNVYYTFTVLGHTSKKIPDGQSVLCLSRDQRDGRDQSL